MGDLDRKIEMLFEVGMWFWLKKCPCNQIWWQRVVPPHCFWMLLVGSSSSTALEERSFSVVESVLRDKVVFFFNPDVPQKYTLMHIYIHI